MPIPDSITATRLVQGAGDRWARATQSPFLEAVQAGEISPDGFGRWLTQDYHFALGLLSFQAISLAKVPRSCQATLIGGLAALDSELNWFEGHADRLGFDMAVEIRAACRRYTDFLLRAAHSEPVAVLLAILFGVEASYLAAWSALTPQGPYAEFIERWSAPAFAAYVASLQELAEKHRAPAQQTAFNRVLELEEDFWRMAWEG